MQVLEDELAEAKMTASKSNANSIALKSNYEIQVAELNSRINEMEEEALIESGRARIAGNTTHHKTLPLEGYDCQFYQRILTAEISLKITKLYQRIQSVYVVSMFLLIVSGTRTKMELAWQKERESQKKLINELNTMARYCH